MIIIRTQITVFIVATLLGISSCGLPETNQPLSLKTPSAAVVEDDLAPHRIPAPVAKPAPQPKVKHRHTHEPVARKTPRAARKRKAPVLTSAGVWDRLAACESGGNWSINTGNGYYGGLQFSLSSWRAVGGAGLPSNASRSEQIRRGEMLRSKQGWGAWPACSRKLGLR